MRNIPVFFKLWFAFVALLALTIIGGTAYAVVTIATQPELLGQAAGKVVSGFRETSKPASP